MNTDEPVLMKPLPSAESEVMRMIRLPLNEALRGNQTNFTVSAYRLS